MGRNRKNNNNSRHQKMDDSKERRKSVKSRRRSLRTLQPADIGSFLVDQDESHDTTLDCQPMYGSIWIEKEESPAHVRKPRRSISCSQISQDLANSVIRNKKNIYGKENFSPDPSPIKMVEDTPKRTPVLHSAKASNNSTDNCSTENVWNQENSYEEIGVPRFGHRTLDGSVAEESLVGSISILSLDETDLKSQAQTVNNSVEDELQISLGSFTKREPNSIGTENISLSLDQITDSGSSFIEESSTPPSLDGLLDSVHSDSESPAGVVGEIASPADKVETQIPNDSLSVSSGEIISDVPSKDSPPFSTKLCQDFNQLDLSEVVTTGSDSEATVVSEESDVETLPENTCDPSLSSDETFNSILLEDSSLDECGSLTSDSWCFVKCYPDEKSSDISSLNDTYVSDGCELWETDLSSAGSELSDSWCFSSQLNTARYFNSTPCKTESPISPLVNNDQCVESVKPLNFATGDEIIITEQETIVPDETSSSVHPTMEPSSAPLEEEEQQLPALENLKLEDSPSGSIEECQNQMQEKSQRTELPSTPNNKPTKGKLVKTQPETVSKTSTKQITDSKTKKMNPSVKNTFQSTKRKQIINSEKTVSNQTPTSTTMHNKSSPDLTRKVASIRIKRPTTQNTKIDPSNKGKAPSDTKSSINLKKNTGIKKEPTMGTGRPSKQSSKLEENSMKSLPKSLHPPKAGSPDVIVLDALATSANMNTANSQEEKVKTSSNISKPTKPSSTEKQKGLKGSSKFLPLKTSLHESDPNQSLPQPDQQVNSETIPVSFEEITTKADSAETLPESPIKKRPRKIINDATSNQVTNRPTLTARTKRRSLDSLATSTVTIRRPNSRSRPKSTDITDTTCNAEAAIDLVPVKNPVPSKWEKHRRRALVIPAQANDVTVVDLEPSASTSSSNDSIFSDIFNKQVTRRTKRRCQSIGSTNLSTENSIVNDDRPSADSTGTLLNPSTSDRDDEHTTESKSVGSGSSTTEGCLETESQDSVLSLNKNVCTAARGKRKYRRSTGSVPERGVQNLVAESESPASEPVKILDDSVLAVQNQTNLRRSTRRRSIELSLSSNSNLKQTSTTAAHGNKKTTAPTRPVDKRVNDDYDDEQLRVIYAKKPYVPVTPSRLETIYSPNKKRGECSVFSKRKLSRTITFQPTDARLKLRRKKAMRNWPFLFEVEDVDEKLYRLLYNPE